MAVSCSGPNRILFLCVVFSLLQVSLTQTCEKLDDCSCRKSNGKVISLWENDIRFKREQDTFTYYWTPCTPFDDEACKDTLLCQSYRSTNFFPIGKTAKSFTVNGHSVDLEYNSVTYKGEKGPVTRTGKITLTCDQTNIKGTLGTFKETGSDESKIYSSTFTSRCACEGMCPRPAKSGGASPGGLSVGSILLIVFFPLVLVYLIGGILFNKYQRGIQSVPEIFPNYSFWADFPYLVKDGFVFTFKGIARCCHGLERKIKGESYAEI